MSSCIDYTCMCTRELLVTAVGSVYVYVSAESGAIKNRMTFDSSTKFAAESKLRAVVSHTHEHCAIISMK